MTDACMYCRLVDTVEHTTVECLRREELRDVTYAKVGVTLTPDTCMAK